MNWGGIFTFGQVLWARGLGFPRGKQTLIALLGIKRDLDKKVERMPLKREQHPVIIEKLPFLSEKEITRGVHGKKRSPEFPKEGGGSWGEAPLPTTEKHASPRRWGRKSKEVGKRAASTRNNTINKVAWNRPHSQGKPSLTVIKRLQGPIEM